MQDSDVRAQSGSCMFIMYPVSYPFHASALCMWETENYNQNSFIYPRVHCISFISVDSVELPKKETTSFVCGSLRLVYLKFHQPLSLILPAI